MLCERRINEKRFSEASATVTCKHLPSLGSELFVQSQKRTSDLEKQSTASYPFQMEWNQSQIPVKSKSTCQLNKKVILYPTPPSSRPQVSCQKFRKNILSSCDVEQKNRRI